MHTPFLVPLLQVTHTPSGFRFVWSGEMPFTTTVYGRHEPNTLQMPIAHIVVPRLNTVSNIPAYPEFQDSVQEFMKSVQQRA